LAGVRSYLKAWKVMPCLQQETTLVMHMPVSTLHLEEQLKKKWAGYDVEVQ